MKLIKFVVIGLGICYLSSSTNGIFWNIFSLRKNKVASDSKMGKTKGGSLRSCDENKIMLQLAKLYIVNPERIILLLTTDDLDKTCGEISSVLAHINAELSSCTLPPNNLYGKLHNGLVYFHSKICGKDKDDWKALLNYRVCLKELKEQLIECEGTPDWYEKGEQKAICKSFSEIINCIYVKTAMLCGSEAGHLLRKFSAEVLNTVLLVRCRPKRLLPSVDEPMISKSFTPKPTFLKLTFIYFSLFYLLKFY